MYSAIGRASLSLAVSSTKRGGRDGRAPRGSAGAGDLLDGGRVLQAREIAEVGGAEVLCADDPPHDLGVASPGQIADEADLLRPQRSPELRRHDVLDALAQAVGRLLARLEHYEQHDTLALDRVGHADRGGLRDGRVADRRRLDLGWAEPLAGDLDGVVGAALDEPEAVLVDGGPIAVDPDIRDSRPVGRLVP